LTDAGYATERGRNQSTTRKRVHGSRVALQRAWEGGCAVVTENQSRDGHGAVKQERNQYAQNIQENPADLVGNISSEFVAGITGIVSWSHAVVRCIDHSHRNPMD